VKANIKGGLRSRRRAHTLRGKRWRRAAAGGRGRAKEKSSFLGGASARDKGRPLAVASCPNQGGAPRRWRPGLLSAPSAPRVRKRCGECGTKAPHHPPILRGVGAVRKGKARKARCGKIMLFLPPRRIFWACSFHQIHRPQRAISPQATLSAWRQFWPGRLCWPRRG
jgi:hypothetical protein